MEERLQKFLSRAGVASRRKAEGLILEGRITVNGSVVRVLGTKVDPATDEVRFDTVVVRLPGSPRRPPRSAAATSPTHSPSPTYTPSPVTVIPTGPQPGGVYLMMNKPLGVLCTVSDDRGRQTVMDLLPRIRERVFPVGRLDEDSEGLLLLTNDGELTNLLTHPRYQVPKTYDMRIRGEITPEDVQKVERGVWLSEGRTGQARMRIRRRGREFSHVEITLREGRNRELRRIFARLRHPVLSLRRVSLGPLELEALRPGQVRRLTPGEVRSLYAAARTGGGPAPSRGPDRGARRRGTRPPQGPPKGSRQRRPHGPPQGPSHGPTQGPGRRPPQGPGRRPPHGPPKARHVDGASRRGPKGARR